MKMAKKGVSCVVFITTIVLMSLVCVAVGLMVYFWTRPHETTSTPSPATTPTPSPRSKPYGRLPRSLSPSQYHLSLQPYFPAGHGVLYPPEREFTFDGNLTILMDCLIQTDNITLHMNKIALRNETIKVTDTTDGRVINVSAYNFDPSIQVVTFFVAPSSLTPGHSYELSMGYIGKLDTTSLSGFYPSSYVDKGETHWLVATQFEPTDARKALPCFDEPGFKASYHIKITHPSHMKALANGMEISTNPVGNGWSQTVFEPTPRMSSYLLAFAVCEFESKNSYTKDKKTLFRVWARPSLIDQADYAVAAGPKVLDYYADYFNISFPLKKQDMLAIPDFSAGAMENWGLVTYRESALLYDNNTYASTNRQRVAVVIAHELSHQWFGDLVTMAWWDDLWLNEGFARYMEFVGSDVIADGAFSMDQQFISNVDSAMASDQWSSSHPIVVNVQTPDEINSIFDDISYNKGAAVLRMLNYTVSSGVFQSGLRSYLARHQYKNAVHEDLWTSLGEVLNEKVQGWDNGSLNVSEYMNPWIKQVGYPIVNVKRQYEGHSGKAVVTQERYEISLNETNTKALWINANTSFNNTWYVPIWYQNQDNKEVYFVWLTPQEPLVISTPADTEWILMNYESGGYYRVNYDEMNWKLLQKQLRRDPEAINLKNRAQLLYDAFSLARAGYLKYHVALDTTLYLKNETAHIPWKAAISGFTFLEDMLILSPDFQYYRNYMLTLMMPLYDHTGWNDSSDTEDDVLSHYSRSLSKATQCRLGYPDCLDKAKALFQEFESDCDSPHAVSAACSRVPTNLRKTVYCAGGGDETGAWWDLLWNLHQREQVAVEKDNLMYGLCCTRSPGLLTKLLDEAINPNSTVVRRQDSRFVFNYIGNNDVGRVLLWQYLEDNWPTISSFGRVGGGSALALIVTAATQSFNTEFQAKTLENFYETNIEQLGSGARPLQQQIERVNSNVQWMRRHRQDVVRWFKEQSTWPTEA